MTDRVARRVIIHRPSRLGAVWLTYRTRLPFWALLFGVGLFFGSVAWHFYFTDKDTNRYALSSAPSPVPMASCFSKEFDQKIEWSAIRTLSVHKLEDCKQLLTPGAIPRLESLTIYDTITDEQVAGICQLYDLKSLTIYSIDKVTVEGFCRLKDQVNLEYLQVAGLKQLRDAPSLDWPPNVRTLICDEPYGISLSRLNEWQQLARLTCLSTRLILLDSHQPKEKLEALGRFPRLTQLFVTDLPDAFPGADFVQKALLRVRVRPATFSPVRGQCAGWILGGGFMVILLLLAQVTTQFMAPARLLTPHFVRSHIEPVIVAYLVIVCVSFYLYVLVGCHDLVAMGLCGLPVFVFAGASRLMHRSVDSRGSDVVPFTHPSAVGPISLFPIMGILAVVIGFGSEFDWFLRGHYQWLHWMFFAGSIWGPFFLVKWLFGLRHQIEAAGCGTIPLSLFDAAGLVEWQSSMANARIGGVEQKARFAVRLMDSQLEAKLEKLPKRKNTLSLALWRIGCGGVLPGWLMRMFLSCFSIIVVVILQFPDLWSQYGQYLASFSFQMLVGSLVCIYAPGQIAPSEIELLRPRSRRDWVNQWFYGIGREFIPVLLSVAFVGFAVFVSGRGGNWTAMDIGLVLIIGAGATGILFAGGMSIFTIKSLLVAAVVGSATLFTSIVFLFPVILRAQAEVWPDWKILIGTIVGLYSLAFGGLWLVHRRWLNWEIGRAA